MPVTARLSRKFYERFGDELTNELVEWFNSVDLTYRGELRELNDLNFTRFDAKLQQRVGQLEVKLDMLKADLSAGIAGAEARIIRWTFLFFAASLGTLIALARL